MLEERSTSSEHTDDVASLSNSHLATSSSPLKHEVTHRPAVRPTESALDTSRQSEVIDQVGVIHLLQLEKHDQRSSFCYIAINFNGV